MSYSRSGVSGYIPMGNPPEWIALQTQYQNPGQVGTFVPQGTPPEFVSPWLLGTPPINGLGVYLPMPAKPEFTPLLAPLNRAGLSGGCGCGCGGSCNGMGRARGVGQTTSPVDLSFLTTPIAGVPTWVWVVGGFALGYFAPQILQAAQSAATPPPPPPPRRKSGGLFGF
jgi:hypothetical protein